MKIIIKYFLLFFGSCWVINSSAQEKAKKEDTYLYISGIPLSNIPSFEFDSVDNEKESIKAEKVKEEDGVGYFAKILNVDIPLKNKSSKKASTGFEVSVARIRSNGALELILFLKNLDLQEGEEILIYDKLFKRIESYTSSNYTNKDSLIVTDHFEGDEVIIEFKYKSVSPKLKLFKIGHVFAVEIQILARN